MTVQAESAATLSPPTSAENVDDQAIVLRIRAGETHLYETIMRRYNQRLFRIARSILPDDKLAEDAVQDAYVAAYYALDHYQPHGSFAGWLTQITINEARMSRRKRTRRPEFSLTGIGDSAFPSDPHVHANPARDFANQSVANLIETAMEQLPENFRLVFVMRGVQQLSVEDTSITLQIPPATVKSRYHRARKLMQKTLAPYIEEAGLNVFEFAGQRCDNLVRKVMSRLTLGQ